jgi:hypothetical protein
VILWQDRYYTGWEAWLPELWKVMGLPQMPLSQAGTGRHTVDVMVIYIYIMGE